MKRNSGFTLIELLVVITIIGILAGLSFPAVNGALEAAKKTEANAVAQQLQTAMVAYQAEYGRWPGSVMAGVFDAGDLFDLLQGDESATSDNPRRIVFIEFKSKNLRVNLGDNTPPENPSEATTFVDPWNNQYQMVLDVDYDNEVAAGGAPDGLGSTLVNATVAVWSNGKDNIFDPRDPKSW